MEDFQIPCQSDFFKLPWFLKHCFLIDYGSWTKWKYNTEKEASNKLHSKKSFKGDVSEQQISWLSALPAMLVQLYESLNIEYICVYFF